MRMLDGLLENGLESCSLRWAIIVKALPCDAVSLSGKPATKG
jgi:hypothetical protein